MNTIIYRAIEAVEIGLLNLPPQQLGFPKAVAPSAGAPSAKAPQSQNLQQDEIENGCHQLETLLVDSADKTFDKFEIYTLRNILTVEEGLAPWMRLSHYEVRHLYRPKRARETHAGISRSMLNIRLPREMMTGPPSPPPRKRRNPRIHPRASPQAARNPETQLCAPCAAAPQRTADHSPYRAAYSFL